MEIHEKDSKSPVNGLAFVTVINIQSSHHSTNKPDTKRPSPTNLPEV